MGFVKYICEFPELFPGVRPRVELCINDCSLPAAFRPFKSADASLLSVYLVGFQLRFRGSCYCRSLGLDLPPIYKCLLGLGRVFGSMRDTRLYDAYRVDSNEWILPELAAAVLLIHFFVGAAMVFWGCQQKRWN